MRSFVPVLAVILVVVGLFGLISGGVSYLKDRDTAHIGPVDVTVSERGRIPVSPIIGALLVVSGVVMFFAVRRS